ncbi:hypothetical protein D3C87_1525380 [compost metagenome]
MPGLGRNAARVRGLRCGIGFALGVQRLGQRGLVLAYLLLAGRVCLIQPRLQLLGRAAFGVQFVQPAPFVSGVARFQCLHGLRVQAAHFFGFGQQGLHGALRVFQLPPALLQLVVALTQLPLRRLQALFGGGQLRRGDPQAFLQILCPALQLDFPLLKLLGLRGQPFALFRQLFPALPVALCLLGAGLGQRRLPKVRSGLGDRVGYGGRRGERARILDARA